MSVLICGGHCGMKGQYREICAKHGYRAKVFTRMPAKFQKVIGCPHGIILFTEPVSHKMAKVVMREAKRKRIPLIRCHNGSGRALEDCLKWLNHNGE